MGSCTFFLPVVAVFQINSGGLTSVDKGIGCDAEQSPHAAPSVSLHPGSDTRQLRDRLTLTVSTKKDVVLTKEARRSTEDVYVTGLISTDQTFRKKMVP